MLIVILVSIGSYNINMPCYLQSARPTHVAYIRYHRPTVLPATHICFLQREIFEHYNYIPSSIAVFRCILAALHFTLPEEMGGPVNPPASGVEPEPPRMRGGDRNHSAMQTGELPQS